RGGDRGGREPHVARDGDPSRPEVADEPPADEPRRLLVDFGRIQPADVVGLEDGRVDRHSELYSVTTVLSPSTTGFSTETFRPMWQLRPRIEPRTDASRPIQPFGQMMDPSMTAASSTCVWRPTTE